MKGQKLYKSAVFFMQGISLSNLTLPSSTIKGGDYHTDGFFFRCIETSLRPNPGHLSNLNFILCNNLDEKKIGVLPKMGVG